VLLPYPPSISGTSAPHPPPPGHLALRWDRIPGDRRGPTYRYVLSRLHPWHPSGPASAPDIQTRHHEPDHHKWADCAASLSTARCIFLLALISLAVLMESFRARRHQEFHQSCKVTDSLDTVYSKFFPLEALVLSAVHLPYLLEVTLASRHNMKNALRVVLIMDVPGSTNGPVVVGRSQELNCFKNMRRGAQHRHLMLMY